MILRFYRATPGSLYDSLCNLALQGYSRARISWDESEGHATHGYPEHCVFGIEMCVDSVENQVLGIAKHINNRRLARSMLPFSLSLVPQAKNALLHSGVTLGMGAPLLAPPSSIWRPLSPQETVLLNVSAKIKSRPNSENDGKNLKKCTFLASNTYFC